MTERFRKSDGRKIHNSMFVEWEDIIPGDQVRLEWVLPQVGEEVPSRTTREGVVGSITPDTAYFRGLRAAQRHMYETAQLKITMQRQYEPPKPELPEEPPVYSTWMAPTGAGGMTPFKRYHDGWYMPGDGLMRPWENVAKLGGFRVDPDRGEKVDVSRAGWQ